MLGAGENQRGEAKLAHVTQALHFATELVGRFERERRGIRSYALVADTSLITAVANDYSFDVIFARQIESLCRPGDVAVGLSTSGNSANVLSPADMAMAIPQASQNC